MKVFFKILVVIFIINTCSINVYAYSLKTPTSVEVELVTTSRVQLTWNDNSTGEMGYRIQRKMDNGAFSTISTTNANNTSFLDYGLLMGHTYTYRVCAYYESTISHYTSEVSAVIIVPQNLVVGSISDTKIRVDWTYPADMELDKNLIITYVERYTPSEPGYIEVAKIKNGGTTFTDSNLEPGTKYYYRLKCSYNGVIVPVPAPLSGTGVYGHTGLVPPQSVTYKVISDNAVEFRYKNTNSTDPNLFVERKVDNGSFEEIFDAPNHNNLYADIYTDWSIALGHIYTYRFSFRDNYTKSATAKEITIYTITPKDLTVEGIASDEIYLNWEYAENLPINYKEMSTIIERSKGDMNHFKEIYTAPPGEFEYYDSDLDENTYYYYRVKAAFPNQMVHHYYPHMNSATGEYTKMKRPTNFSGYADTDYSIELSWEFEYKEDSDYVCIEILNAEGFYETFANGVRGHTYKITGLNYNNDYTYRIYAYSNSTSSKPTESTTITTETLFPPEYLTAEPIQGKNAILLKWESGESIGTGYDIWRKGSNDKDWLFIAELNTSKTDYVDEDINTNVSYLYKVRARKNTNIYSQFTKTADAGILIPEAPTNLTAKTFSDGRVHLNWTDNAANEDYHAVEMKEGITGQWTEFSRAVVNARYTSIRLPDVEKTYYIRVSSCNATYNTKSYSDTVLVDFKKPNAPYNLQIQNASNESISLSWMDNSSNETSFLIYRKDTAGIYKSVGRVDTNITKFMDTYTLVPGETYTYKVHAVSQAGESAPSLEVATKLVPAASFNDIGNYAWANNAIESLYSKGIISGNGGGKFYPSATITRAEFIRMVIDAFNIDTASIGKIDDVPYDTWYYKYIMKAYQAGIISPDIYNNFYPNDPITREDMSIFLSKGAIASGKGLKGYSINVLDTFTDSDEIFPEARGYLAILYGNGVISGKGNNILAPRATAKRAEAAIIMYLYLEKIK